MDKKIVYNPECGSRVERLARLAEVNYERVTEIRDQMGSERESLHDMLKTKPDTLDFTSIAKFIELQETYTTAMKAFNQSMKMYYDHV